MTQPLVTVEVDAGVADIRLNRPDKHNALTLEMFSAIQAAAVRVAADASVRVAVLSGNGASFCAGLDLSLMRLFQQGPEQSQAAIAQLFTQGAGPGNAAQHTVLAWRAMPVPVIAALRGSAFGGGCQIALGADLRIAAPDARLSLMEIRYGLIPDMGATQTLRTLVARDVALDLILTGRIVPAQEARELGLVTRIAADPLEAAFALARDIASRSPDAVRAAKRLMNGAWHADERSGLLLEQSLQTALLGSPNQREAVTAALEKRAPSFRDATTQGPLES